MSTMKTGSSEGGDEVISAMACSYGYAGVWFGGRLSLKAIADANSAARSGLDDIYSKKLMLWRMVKGLCFRSVTSLKELALMKAGVSSQKGITLSKLDSDLGKYLLVGGSRLGVLTSS